MRRNLVDGLIAVALFYGVFLGCALLEGAAALLTAGGPR